MENGRSALMEPLARSGDRPVPGYCLVRRRGRGGFGEVWEAEAAGGFRVALKIVRLPSEARSAEVSALTVVRGIRHPNLLVSFGAWQEDGVLIVGMELADRSLWDRFIEAEDQGLRGIPRGELLGYLWDVATGIDHLNEPRHTLDGRPGVGVQHRDLKPQNILLFGGGAKVADFGEAQVMDGPVAPNNGTWTLSYAAPEYFEGFTSHRSDQYALAVTYCQLRGGQLPYFGNDVTVTAGHLLGTPDLEGLPEAERPILARALEKRPEDRWPDCTAMIGALRAIGTADGLLVPDILYGPPAWDDTFRRRGSSSSGERSGTTTPLDSITSWNEFDDDLAADSDFELPHPDEVEVISAEPVASASPPEPAAASIPSEGGVPAVCAIRGGASPRVMGTRAAVLLLTAGLVLAATEARTSAGRLLRFPITTRRDPSLRRAVQAVPTPAPATIAHEILRSPLGIPSTVRNVSRPPGIVTSTVAGDPDAGSIRPEQPLPAPASPAPAVATATARSAHEEPARPALVVDGPLPPAAEIAEAATSPLPDAPSTPSSERIDDLPAAAPDVVDRGRPRTEEAAPALEAPALELPREVRVRAGESAKLRVRIDRRGGLGPATLRFSGISRGVTVDGLAIPSDAQETEVEVSAAPDAPPTVADFGVSAEMGDRRAEARVRVHVQPSTASEAYTRGRELLDRGELALASEEFGETIKFDPGHAQAYLFRAVAAHRAGRRREAQADYTEAIRLKPDIDIAYGARGRIYYEIGDLTRALADYDKAIRLKSGNPITLGARGRIYTDLGHYDRALADFTEVIRLKPESAEARYRRGQIRYYSGDNAAAVVDFSDAIKLDPAHAWAYRLRGDAFARLGNRARADADHAMVERLAGRLARPVDQRGSLPSPTTSADQLKKGDRSEAAPKGPTPRKPVRRASFSQARDMPR